MPIYEFACNDCGTKFEKRVSFSATDAPPCDSCESENVQRLLSAPAIHFKGSGWYINDSKKASNGAASGETKSTDGDSASSNASENGGANGETKSSTDSSSSDSSSSASKESSSEKKSTAKESA